MSPYGGSKLGSPALGHLADGLGLQHCLTGSFGESHTNQASSTQTSNLDSHDFEGEYHEGDDDRTSKHDHNDGNYHQSNEHNVDNVDFRQWNSFQRRRLDESYSRSSDSGGGGGVQLTARELNTCLDFFNLKNIPKHFTNTDKTNTDTTTADNTETETTGTTQDVESNEVFI